MDCRGTTSLSQSRAELYDGELYDGCEISILLYAIVEARLVGDGGIVTLTGPSHNFANSDPSSGRDARALPNVERCGSKFLQHRLFEEVTLVVESVVGRGVDGEETLREAG